MPTAPAPRPYNIRPVRIACINQAQTPLGVDFNRLAAALQQFYDKCFLPIWGYPIQLYNTTKPAPGDWPFYYLDKAPDNSLGYHDLTENGQPVSRVFVKSTLDAGELVSVTACHELCEVVLDPLVNIWAEAPDGTQFAYEACDAVEEDSFLVAGIPMSNFLTPAWFEPFKHPAGTKFDYLGKLSRPFSLSKGGYTVVRTTSGAVKEVFASKAKARRFAKEDRRGHRSEFRKALKKTAPRARRRRAAK